MDTIYKLRPSILVLVFLVLSCFKTNALAQEIKASAYLRRQAPTPPMGWNSWNWFGKKEINEKVVREVIDAMVNEGLRDAGYNYLVIDGGWRDTKLSPNGELKAHPVKFPNGIKALADYAHSKGLKFGLHTVPGTHDCGGDKVGGYGHEEVQLNQFINWGVDFIKLDKCKFTDGWNEDLLKSTYLKWTNLIEKSGRNIVLNVSAYEFRDWNPQASNMSRTTYDILAKVNGGSVFDSIVSTRNFFSVMAIAEQNNKWAEYARPGYWNDPEMLVTGEQGLTSEEQKIHFALWGIMSAPLFLGNDPRNMLQSEKEIILNKEAISINQDPTEQGKRIKVAGDTEIWAKKLIDGKLALLFFNRNHSDTKNIKLNLRDLGITEKMTASEVYTKKDLGNYKKSISMALKPRSSVYIILSKKE